MKLYKPSPEERWLRDLLALIHRDGGHHTTKVGLEQSTKDAREKYKWLREGFGLAHSMVLSGEKITSQARKVFNQALNPKG